MGCWTIIKLTHQWTWKITCRRHEGMSKLTCRMANIPTKAMIETEQIATATIATNVTGDLIWSLEAAPPSIDVTSRRAASLLNKFPSSASCDNCFSAAIRRLPAGEELMHSPAKMRKGGLVSWGWWMCQVWARRTFSCRSNLFLSIVVYLSLFVFPSSFVSLCLSSFPWHTFF